MVRPARGGTESKSRYIVHTGMGEVLHGPRYDSPQPTPRMHKLGAFIDKALRQLYKLEHVSRADFTVRGRVRGEAR